MVVRVRLAGLNVRKARGKWYVSHRLTGDSLLRGFEGSREDLDKRLAQPDILTAYNLIKRRNRGRVYGKGTLGELVRWFKNECPSWDKLSPASRQDYEKTFAYLEPEFDTPIALITQPDVYEVRNKAAKAKWGRFADKLVSHLSKMFHEAKKVGRAETNPAAGVEKVHSADPNANHEWRPAEVQEALSGAPTHILTPLILARFQGFRGQTCAALLWSAYIDDPQFGKAFSVTLRKNNEPSWFPAASETRAHLAMLDKSATHICTARDGTPWPSEKTLQGAVSDYLDRLKESGKIRKGCTLHGLRVTYAASIRRRGHDAGTVADALGDRSEAMGKHYTRHVEKEASLIRIFDGKAVVQK